jgi:drug/metabolite transporter (DMT)-like permease
MSQQPTLWSRFGGIATLVLTLLGWSSIPLFLKSFIHEIDGWTANGWRYAFSALIWAPTLLWAYRSGRAPRGLWRAALIPSVFNAAGQALFGLAPYHVDVGLMTFSLRVQILFVTVGAAILFVPERRIVKTPGFILGLLMVAAGTMGTIALNPKSIWSGTGLGVAMSIGSGLLYACYSLAVRRSMLGMNPLVAFAAISQYTALGLVVPMLILAPNHGADAAYLPTNRIALLLLSSLIGIGLGHTFYYISIARLGVAVSAGVIQLQPLIVSIASFFLFGERLTPGQWTCGLVAILGAAVILTTQHRLSRRDHAPVGPADIEEFRTLPLDADTAAAGAQHEPAPGAVAPVTPPAPGAGRRARSGGSPSPAPPPRP